mgnify:CR=1 FL=1
MKCWIVPSSLFVPGRIMAPIRLLRDKEALLARKEKIEAELAALPNKLNEVNQELTQLGEEYLPFKSREI